MTDTPKSEDRAAYSALSPGARSSLNELLRSGPGIPLPEETDELVANGFAVRVTMITPLGRQIVRGKP